MKIKIFLLYVFFVSIFFASPCALADVSTSLMSLKTGALGQVWVMLIALSQIIGIGFAFSAIMKLKKFGQNSMMSTSHPQLMGPIVHIFIASALLFLPLTLDSILNTFWGYDYSSVKSYISTSGTSNWDAMIQPVILIIRIIGLIAFIRGWIILARTATEGAQPGTFGKAVTHIVGGVLAVNIVGTITVLQNTFGS